MGQQQPVKDGSAACIILDRQCAHAQSIIWLRKEGNASLLEEGTMPLMNNESWDFLSFPMIFLDENKKQIKDMIATCRARVVPRIGEKVTLRSNKVKDVEKLGVFLVLDVVNGFVVLDELDIAKREEQIEAGVDHEGLPDETSILVLVRRLGDSVLDCL